MTDATDSPEAPVRIEGLRRTVADLRRAREFYCGALGFEASGPDRTDPAGTARVRLGEQWIDLVLRSDAAAPPPSVNAPDPRFQHAAIVTRDIEGSWRRLEAHGAESISLGGPERLPAHTGGVAAFKFRDPDGHPLELIEFPKGVGNPRWHADRAGGPTLGIDHFALVVGDVERSVAFVVGRLGWKVVGRDVNLGVEQDRLDGLDGVEVDVVSLEPAHGPRAPHLELLHYRRPTAPVDGSASAGPGSDEIVCLSQRPTRAGPGTVALIDPDGHRFTVVG